MAVLNCDALALLVVRLESDQPDKESDLHWHTWYESCGAQPHGLPEEEEEDGEDEEGEEGHSTGWEEPFKSMPREGARSYFNEHVERLLFPPGNKRGARWLCCPDQLHLELGKRVDGPVRRTRVELLERLTSPLDPSCTFGLIHLSLLPPEEAEAPDTIWWRRTIASPFQFKGSPPRFALCRGEDEVNLNNGRPVRKLVEELFGDPHPTLERSLYTVVMANCEDGEEEETRRALTKHLLTAKSRTPNARSKEREERQTIPIAAPTALLLGRSATFTLTEPIKGSYARSLRSFWAESIVLGLLQQEHLEEFQRRLAAVEDIRGSDIEGLYGSWLEFRNVLWWSQLAGGGEVPQELLAGLRNELGSERLFTDLEGDLATYSESRRRAIEDRRVEADERQAEAEGRQANALANLQIYGSGLVVLAPVLAAIQLFGPTDTNLLWALIAASIIFAVGFSALVRRLLSQRQG